MPLTVGLLGGPCGALCVTREGHGWGWRRREREYVQAVYIPRDDELKHIRKGKMIAQG
jgi:hypothetical protein